VPAALQGARGFWVASTAGLAVAAIGLTWLLLWVLRRTTREASAPSTAG
jgi:MATE family multidrug resistance protein